MTPAESLTTRATSLGLYGLLAHLSDVASQPWVETLLEWEESERACRGLARRIQAAHIGRFRPMADFDWAWPDKIDRDAVEESFRLDFISQADNLVLLGPNGVGKTMIAQNLCYQAVLRGVPALFTTASALLADLSERHTSYALQQRLRHYSRPKLLCIDEIGYLSYDARAADLLFEVITRRYQRASTIVSTNKAFSEWHEIFPNATSVVTLIDRLTHQAEVLSIEGESYRLKESRERAEKKQQSRRSQRKKSSST
ncbi:IS21-like element helper ATPase IstB [Haliangium sp. UPWRP_2]|uniref:IS21-like element helper ATPase IstB n=1 Tax=Haliangium sp. UPWRP_2 TaxID=1931276 RepID=UPI000B546863|nr:IS21-like element helper ATPase IstB [Haliangium sp. UPWRP_2]PSM30590.1 cell division protein ZapE [Haliangium sp. UPWRP_2]